MKRQHPLARRCVTLPFLLLTWLVGLLPAAAQTGTGSIQGRVYNPVEKEYVNNAEVRLTGTNLVTYTAQDGTFQFDNVPAGPAEVTVKYTGYTAATDKFVVSAGQATVREISLASSAEGEKGVLKLDAFTVSSAREGNSKAIMAQRKDMN